MLSVLSLAPIIEVLRRSIIRLLYMIDGHAHHLMVANLAGRPTLSNVGAVYMHNPAYLSKGSLLSTFRSTKELRYICAIFPGK
jgi:hypothetical protein